MTFPPLPALADNGWRDTWAKAVHDAATGITAPGAIYATVYGAKFDGSTNDTAAIQAAVNAAAAVRGVVHLPPGIAIVGFIDLKGTGVTIRGAGAGRTELRPRSGATLQSMFGSTGAASNITIEGITVRGAAVDEGVYPRRGRTYSGTQLNSAVDFAGDRLPTGSSVVVRDIEVRNCEFIGTTGLPVLFRGVSGSAVVDSCRFYNCLDVGWIYCERAVCTNNTAINSADNGFSLSRGNQSVTCVGNTVDRCAYWGIWVAGFEFGQGAQDAGPRSFTVTGNVITNAGQGGIALSDAPRNGVVTGNLVDTVRRGPTDQPSDLRGIGIYVTAYPSSDPTNPQVYAENINLSGNTLIGCARGGILVTGANDILITGNLIINPGSEFLADGVTPVAANDLQNNFGISILFGPNATVSRMIIRANQMVDKRATPYGNWPLYTSGAIFARYSGNNHFGFRQANVVLDDNVSEQTSGVKTFQAAVNFSAPLRLASFTTSGRPSASSSGVGAEVFDTTLGRPIYSDGTNWKDATGTVV